MPTSIDWLTPFCVLIDEIKKADVYYVQKLLRCANFYGRLYNFHVPGYQLVNSITKVAGCGNSTTINKEGSPFCGDPSLHTKPGWL